MLISINGLNKTINDKQLIKNATFSIEENEKVALVGVNGTGKSTFLKILSGIEPYDSGSIIKKNGLNIYYLTQNPVFSQNTIMEELVYQNRLNKHPKEDFEIKTFLTKLGLLNFDQCIQELSGGQQRKLSIAKALVSDCDLLLLDEPTNHLDNDMIDWLEGYLLKLKKSVVLVTHDRYFLNRICTRIFELDRGDFYIHNGNYEVYVQNKQEREILEAKAIQKHNNLYRKELAWVQAGCQARSTKQQARLDAFEKLRQQRFKTQEKELELTGVSKRLGKKTIELEHVSFGYGDDYLINDFSYNFLRNDRVGFIGKNGCGKSTLLNLIANQTQPQQGTISYGETVSIGYFKQQDLQDEGSIRVIDYIEKTSQVIEQGKNVITASQMLEKFLFDKKMQYTTIDRLSGGERKRLYLCKILMQAPNVLILDEPTNDLDILTLEVLEDYLDDFNGIVIVVSHDRYFLDRVCDKVFAFEDGYLHEYNGGYSDYLLKIQSDKTYTKKEKKEWKQRKVTLSYQEKKELEMINEQMPILEQEINDINEQLNSIEEYTKISELCDMRDKKENLLEEYTMRWMELEEKMES